MTYYGSVIHDFIEDNTSENIDITLDDIYYHVHNLELELCYNLFKKDIYILSKYFYNVK